MNYYLPFINLILNKDCSSMVNKYLLPLPYLEELSTVINEITFDLPYKFKLLFLKVKLFKQSKLYSSYRLDHRENYLQREM
jgi:hypothetical protein